MHAIKGGWVGQTFALALSSDSGGKKSRIRRSKEERKTMVESFIKTYQILNHGNFPSLNLTHKEVGGSFYTVREIVREIIQENRVLGPAMSPLEEEDSKNDIMQQYPIGSIAVQPLICSPLEVSDALRHVNPKQYPDEKGELLFTRNEDQGFEWQNEQELEHPIEGMKENGSDGDSTVIEESDEQVLVTLSVHHEDINQESHQDTIVEQFIHTEKEHLRSIKASKKNSDFIEPIQINTVVQDSSVAFKEQSNGLGISLPEVAVETFPPRPVTQTRTVNGSDGRLDEHRVQEEMGNEHETKSKSENISSVLNVEIGACSASEKLHGSLDEKASHSNGYSSSEISESSTANKTLVVDDNDGVINETDVLSIEKLVNAPKDINENSGSLDNTTLDEQTTMEVTAATNIKPSIVDDNSSSNNRHSTLDRTKLETWEGTSQKKPSTTEIDSVVALFKAFVVAVVKFFTE